MMKNIHIDQMGVLHFVIPDGTIGQDQNMSWLEWEITKLTVTDEPIATTNRNLTADNMHK